MTEGREPNYEDRPAPDPVEEAAAQDAAEDGAVAEIEKLEREIQQSEGR